MDCDFYSAVIRTLELHIKSLAPPQELVRDIICYIPIRRPTSLRRRRLRHKMASVYLNRNTEKGQAAAYQPART